MKIIHLISFAIIWFCVGHNLHIAMECRRTSLMNPRGPFLLAVACALASLYSGYFLLTP